MEGEKKENTQEVPEKQEEKKDQMNVDTASSDAAKDSNTITLTIKTPKDKETVSVRSDASIKDVLYTLNVVLKHVIISYS